MRLAAQALAKSAIEVRPGPAEGRCNGSNEVDVVLDASFIKAWSIRHPTDNQIGLLALNQSDYEFKFVS